jgi:hypothetical protein
MLRALATQGEIHEFADSHERLRAERDLLRAAAQRGADQLKRGEWNSYNSGTWTILNDALAAVDAFDKEAE